MYVILFLVLTGFCAVHCKRDGSRKTQQENNPENESTPDYLLRAEYAGKPNQGWKLWGGWWDLNPR
jgi:hypothetical protein